MLPGPSAVITALVASGLPTHRWRFQGFLPRRAGELERVLQSPETIVAFESPRRLPESLSGAGDPGARPAGGGLPRADQAARGDRPRHPGRALAALPRRGPRRDRGRDRARPARAGPGDIGFAVDALRGLVRAGARPRAAASVVSALTGVPANELYKGSPDASREVAGRGVALNVVRHGGTRWLRSASHAWSRWATASSPGRTGSTRWSRWIPRIAARAGAPTSTSTAWLSRSSPPAPSGRSSPRSRRR